MNHRNLPAIPSWGQYELLRPAQIEAIVNATPVAYLPWGALEWHGPHNPVGLDGLKAHGLAKSLAQRCGGLVFPPVYAGYQTLKVEPGYRHSIEIPEATVQALAEAFLDQIATEGFAVAVVLLGHYGNKHVAAVQRAVETSVFKHRERNFRAWAFADWEALEGLSESNHAAHGETSLMMALSPELVDLASLARQKLPGSALGIWGRDANESTEADGSAMIEKYVDWAAERVEALLSPTMVAPNSQVG